MPRSTDTLTAGQQALARGAWEEARAYFEAAVAEDATPEAVEGLSWAAWWLNDPATLFEARERAYRLYEENGDHRGAARMAMWLSSDYLDFRGEPAIANGWRQRARRLLEGLAGSPEHGWLALLEGDAAFLLNDDTVAARRAAQEATDIGRRLGIVDLEALGLAMEGIALVSEGQVAEGMSRLDEASVTALAGNLQEIFSVSWALCYLIYACERVRDYDRAAQWCEKMKEFAARFQLRLALGVCHAHYAGVLIWRGTWPDAEAELAKATDELIASRPAMVAEGIVRLAELRRRQGRLPEASELFNQAEGHPLALLGRAELALEQENPREAEDLLEQLLRQVPPENRTQRIAALELLVRVHADLGDHARAADTLGSLQAIATAVATPPVRAATSFAAGLVAVAGGDQSEARRQFEDAVRLFEGSGAPYEAARSRIELANVLSASGRNEAAQKEARAALASAQKIGAAREVERATALLRQPGMSRPVRGRQPGAFAGLTRRQIDILRLVAQGLNDKEIAAKLTLSEHTVHRHVSNILTKLALPSRAAAVAHAARHGLL